ncbi:hypothetical protein GQ42DRAFT_162878 [Ramicandelaber brevisporus]|nr:hypothetical protein GQ42DRAFT_162878 [Ramicandelaber brevisporus]
MPLDDFNDQYDPYAGYDFSELSEMLSPNSSRAGLVGEARTPLNNRHKQLPEADVSPLNHAVGRIGLNDHQMSSPPSSSSMSVLRGRDELTSTLNFINNELSNLGISTIRLPASLLSSSSSSSASSSSPESAEAFHRFFKCISSLLKMHQEDLDTRDELNDSLRMLHGKHELLATNHRNQANELDGALRERSVLRDRVRFVETELKRAEDTTKRAMDDAKVMGSAVGTLKTQFRHELKKRGAEEVKLKEAMQKGIGEKARAAMMGRGHGIRVVGTFLGSSGSGSGMDAMGSPGLGMAGSGVKAVSSGIADRALQEQDLISQAMADYEAREQELIYENDALRQALVGVFAELQPLAQAISNFAIKSGDESGDVKRSMSIANNPALALFAAPYTVLNSAVVHDAPVLFAALKQGWDIAKDKLSTSTDSTKLAPLQEKVAEQEKTITALETKVKEYRTIIDNQAKLLSQALEQRTQQQQTVVSTAELEDRLQAERKAIEHERASMDLERRRMTDAMVKLEQEKVQMQTEKAKLEQERSSLATAAMLDFLPKTPHWLKEAMNGAKDSPDAVMKLQQLMNVASPLAGMGSSDSGSGAGIGGAFVQATPLKSALRAGSGPSRAEIEHVQSLNATLNSDHGDDYDHDEYDEDEMDRNEHGEQYIEYEEELAAVSEEEEEEEEDANSDSHASKSAMSAQHVKRSTTPSLGSRPPSSASTTRPAPPRPQSAMGTTASTQSSGYKPTVPVGPKLRTATSTRARTESTSAGSGRSATTSAGLPPPAAATSRVTTRSTSSATTTAASTGSAATGRTPLHLRRSVNPNAPCPRPGCTQTGPHTHPPSTSTRAGTSTAPSSAGLQSNHGNGELSPSTTTAATSSSSSLGLVSSTDSAATRRAVSRPLASSQSMSTINARSGANSSTSSATSAGTARAPSRVGATASATSSSSRTIASRRSEPNISGASSPGKVPPMPVGGYATTSTRMGSSVHSTTSSKSPSLSATTGTPGPRERSNSRSAYRSPG